MRTCPFCVTEIPSDKFACRSHWHMLTGEEKDEIHAAYQDWKDGGDSVENLRRRQQAIIDQAGPRIRHEENHNAEEWRSAAGITPKAESEATSFSQCRACKARIFWATTEDGKTIPMDAEPMSGGNMFRDGDTMKAVSLLNQPAAGTPLYKSHFATCTDPKRFRKVK